MSSNILFEGDYHSICQKRIFDRVGYDAYNYNVYIEIKEEVFDKLFEEYFGVSEKMVKADHVYVKTIDEYDTFYYKTKFADGIAVSYPVSDVSDPEEKEDPIMVAENMSLYFRERHREHVEAFIKELKANAFHGEVKNRFFIIGVDQTGYMLNSENIISTDVNLELNYGAKFLPIHENLVERLANEHSGLVLLHGDPGSGKTTYIRYLIKELCKHKNIIYVPSFLVEQIANPEFISFIERQKGSILILEDAEYVLQSREDGYNVQAVSNLLNITSGLLNDATRIQVIATCNMDKKNIDKALLRPGRLLLEYKFDKLPAEEATALSKHLGKNVVYKVPVTLAEIYVGKSVIKKTKKKVGFTSDDDI
jgi:hypothetical protein